MKKEHLWFVVILVVGYFVGRKYPNLYKGSLA